MQKCMDWRSIKFDWNRARAFLVTAEEGSLSAAARALSMAQPTLGRQVDALEQELGVVLFERVGRGLILTPSGLELLDHVREMGNAANRMSLTANGQARSIGGKICITATDIYSALILPPIIKKLRILEPSINIEIVSSNSPSDLRRREADIALRNFRPTEPDLIAKKVAEVPGRLYATDDYIQQAGPFYKPQDLNAADFINIDSSFGMLEFLNNMGMSLTRDNFPILSENMQVAWELTKQGIGVGLMDGRIGDKEPLVKRALPDLEPIMFPIWLVSHRELNTSRRIRLVFDLLAKELSSPPDQH